MSHSDRDTRVDDLREQLRALGYLDAGVDRFVLGPARETRRPAAIAFLASVRIGVIAALLLGPAAALGLSGRMPGLVTGTRDAGVVALYMGALLGVAVAIASFGMSLLVSSIAGERVARRAGTLSAYAGGAVSVACLVYLTLWWRTANAGFGWSAPVWTGFALAVAAGISLLLGHAVRVTAFAVMAAGHSRIASQLQRVRPTSWKMSAAAGVLAFAGAGALLVLTAPGNDGAQTRPALTVVSSGLRVRLIAIDGFDPGIFAELAKAGRVPSLAAALGAAPARLAAENTRDPARAWTTIATGQTPESHGVEGLETRRVTGLQGTVPTGAASKLVAAISAATDLLRLTRPAITSGNERREKTMWEVASDAGLRSAVINWWATWPARTDTDPNSALIITDRATLRLERGGELDAEIAPASLYAQLAPRWPGIREQGSSRAAQALTLMTTIEPAVAAVLKRSAELDAIQLGLIRELPEPRPDLVAIYLPGLDIAQHALLGTQEGALAASALATRLDALREYYVCLDRLLSDALKASSGELVVLVTEPGRVAAAADGLMAIAGAAPRPLSPLTGRSTDVMPTVLYALGVPISTQLAGSPLLGLFPTDFTSRFPVRHSAGYGRPSMNNAVRTGQPLDQEMLDRLRSLGYVR